MLIILSDENGAHSLIVRTGVCRSGRGHNPIAFENDGLVGCDMVINDHLQGSRDNPTDRDQLVTIGFGTHILQLVIEEEKEVLIRRSWNKVAELKDQSQIIDLEPRDAQLSTEGLSRSRFADSGNAADKQDCPCSRLCVHRSCYRITPL